MEDLWLPLWTSLRVAVLATLFALPVGVSLAWLAVHGRFRRVEWLDMAILLPLLVPAPVLGHYLVLCLGGERPLPFTEAAATLAATIYTIPLTALLANRVFRKIDPIYARLAVLLGASPWQIFRQVSLPLAGRALAAIGVLSIARSFAEFGITHLVARKFPSGASTLPVALYEALAEGPDGAALPFAVILMGITLALLGAAHYIRAGRLLP
jgi:molybdate transport system permease protein